MPITVKWVDEAKTIVLYEFTGSWGWDDLYPVYYEAIALETSVTHRVDVILDMRNSGRIPANVITHLKNISDKQPTNIGLSIFVSSNPFLVNLYNVGVRVYSKIGYYFRVVRTTEEAYAMIAQQRTKIEEEHEGLKT